MQHLALLIGGVALVLLQVLLVSAAVAQIMRSCQDCALIWRKGGARRGLVPQEGRAGLGPGSKGRPGS